jgi:hypothetical protein
MNFFPKILVSGATAGLLAIGCGGNGDTASGSNGVGATTGTSSGDSGPGGSGGAASTGAGGASTTSTTGAGGTSVSTTSSATTGAGGSGSGGFGTIFTILLENHDYDQVVASPDAPYINSLIGSYGLATSYLDSGSHPSLLNYLYLISGDTQFPFKQGVDVGPTTFPFPKDADNLGNQMELAGIHWRSYQENMGTNCNLDGDGVYEPKHNPFLYFKNIQKNAAVCDKTNVDYSQFPSDLAGGTYQYMWITPNMTNNGHNPTGDPVAAIKQADLWLSTEIPKILASQAYQNNGVLFITWDEGTGTFGTTDHVAMIVISPKLKSAGMKVGTKLSHAGYLSTVEEIFGLPKLGDAITAPTLMEFFKP